MSRADDERDTPASQAADGMADEMADEMADAPPPLAWPTTNDATSSPPVEVSSAARSPASGWTGRLIAGAAGAGVVLAALALRDVSPLRRTPATPPSWRRRIANWLRSQDR
jgi:hypothetical protein